MTDTNRHARLSPRLVTTAVIGAIFAAIVGLVKVSTSLGVMVPEPVLGQPDLSGSEYIWRVWWRARDDLIDVSPQWLVTTGLIALLTIFVAGMLLAIWIVCGPPTSDDITPTDG